MEPLLLILLLLVASPLASCKTITIGGILSTQAFAKTFADSVLDLNDNPLCKIPGYEYNATTLIMNPNPIRSAMSVCENLMPQKVYSVVVSHPKDNKNQPPISVSYTCGFYKIPVIGITARDSVFSDVNLHTSYLRTVPPYSHQSRVWLDIVRFFEWKKVVVLHSTDQEGRAIVAMFQNAIGPKEGLVAKVIDYQPGQDDYIKRLQATFSDDTMVFLLSASGSDATKIFRDAVKLNMTDSGYVWIVSEETLEAPNIPDGTIGMKLRESRNEEFHIKDSVQVICRAFKKAFTTYNISEPPQYCSETSSWDKSGDRLFGALTSVEMNNGLTGKVSFDHAGDRLMPVYDIVNIQDGQPVRVGEYGIEAKRLKMDEEDIIWPGNLTTKPEGFKLTTHFRVVTIESVPFVHVRPVSGPEECIDYSPEDEFAVEEYCPKPNETNKNIMSHYCCSGYCISMLQEIARTENFTFEVHLVADNKYGNLERRNGSVTREWNGMMGELVRGEADMIVAPMTIDPDRNQYVEFTKPFKYQGITILVKKEEKNSSLDSFLQPFQDTLWILVILSVHVVALVLYLLDRFSPFGRFKLAKSNDTEEDALNLSSAMWFAWGVLLNSGIGEGTPRSFSARVLGMVWAGFAMIIVASYTANLAAFLVLDRPEASISGIDDARLRNPTKDFTYATVKDSSVYAYFKRQVELSTMHRYMEQFNYTDAAEAIGDVKKKKMSAFIWDSTRLEYESARECSLVTVGELFGRSGFGIGLKKRSPWVNRISVKILNMHESGFMERLDSRWILVENNHCPDVDSSPATLGLTNMAGVFMLVAGGIVAGVFLIFIEIAYKKHRGLKEKELELARNAAHRWRGNIEKRKTLRKTLMEAQNLPSIPHSDTRPNGRPGETSATSMIQEVDYNKSSSTLSDSPGGLTSQQRPMLRRYHTYDSDHTGETF